MPQGRKAGRAPNRGAPPRFAARLADATGPRGARLSIELSVSLATHAGNALRDTIAPSFARSASAAQTARSGAPGLTGGFAPSEVLTIDASAPGQSFTI